MGDRSQRASSSQDYELDWALLKRATNNFSEERKIGAGYWGVVYKGILEDGREIAVKKIDWRFSGRMMIDSPKYMYMIFKTERDYIQHQNIVRSIGSCYDYKIGFPVRIAICSEYVQGGSLDKHVSDASCGLHWHARYKIIKGICEGVNYLHNGEERRVYYGNIKLTNILLDSNMVPKIGNFKLTRSHRDKATVHVSLQGDVFCLGVIIMQIMAGADAHSKYAQMPPQEFVELVHENWRKRFHTAILFPSRSSEVRTCINIALRCVQTNGDKRPTMNEIVDELNNIDASLMDREYTFEDLKRITDQFSSVHTLGEGGYGVVYKGILDGGQEIAMKKLRRNMLWCDDDHQFNSELNILMGIEHPNIVCLVGYCNQTTLANEEYNGRIECVDVKERALCYEYLEKGSLEKHLSDKSRGFDWHTSYKIIRGVCDGLYHLQMRSDHPIYHLDLKPANILLDKDMLPKIGDFGLSRLFGSMKTYLTESQNTTGTRPYMPPEYIDHRQISSKFDIFSLGVLIREIMTAKEEDLYYDPDVPSSEFIELVQKKWRKNMLETMSPHTANEVKTCIEIALRCVEKYRGNRPSIKEIIDELHMLESSKVHL